jgi:hypothetical protein
MSRQKLTTIMILTVALTVTAACAKKSSVRPELLEGPGWTKVDNNLHQVDGPPPGEDSGPAFRAYRSGAPDKETFAKWCDVYKIERVIVMSGDADKHELKYQEEGVCPGIKVIYDVEQNPMSPVGDGFLTLFENEIEKAKKDEVGVLWRCRTGSHRAGRASAYYQMMYQDLTAQEAIAVMDYNGMLMPVFDPFLRPQVKSMHDHINQKPCSQEKRHCVEENSDKWVE